MYKKLCSIVLLILSVYLIFAFTFPLNVNAEENSLKLYDSKVTFNHFAFELNSDNTMKSYDKNSRVDTEFKTKIIENKYTKVTLLPEYGGRILSIIYKPTGNELLYQNPVGTPYGMGEGNFYYDWLMVYGGIFPTFPDPEHGKTWCLPWETRVVVENADKISIEMRFTDNIGPVKGIPSKFSKEASKITCIATVTLSKDSPTVEYNIKLVNNQDKPVDYEYWTCTTFAPGSVPGKTLISKNTEIVAPLNQVKLKDDWWTWMKNAEKPIDSSVHTFQFKNLAEVKNWTDMGIAYANPSVEKDWWGVINHDNEVGILRIANNKKDTPGLKLWTWGYKSSFAADPNKFDQVARPYVELWAGKSLEFFAKSKMSAKEEQSWQEYYIPTVGLSKVTYSNKNAAIYMEATTDEIKNQISFNAELFTMFPNKKLNISLKLKGNKTYDLLDKSFISDPAAANKITVSKSKNSIDKGSYLYEITLKSNSGEILAQTNIPYNKLSNVESSIFSYKMLAILMISIVFLFSISFLVYKVIKKKR